MADDALAYGEAWRRRRRGRAEGETVELRPTTTKKSGGTKGGTACREWAGAVFPVLCVFCSFLLPCHFPCS